MSCTIEFEYFSIKIEADGKCELLDNSSKTTLDSFDNFDNAYDSLIEYSNERDIENTGEEHDH